MMADRIDQLRPKLAESEKITINLGHVDLGHIDLMVQEGFYANRTNLIRTAIRNQIERHADALKRNRYRTKAGTRPAALYPRRAGTVRAAGQTLHIRVLGLASIAKDVTPELARATIGSIVSAGRASRQLGGQGGSGRPVCPVAIRSALPPT